MTSANSLTDPKFSHLFDIRYAITPFTDFGTLPVGRRMHAMTTGGTFEGDRLRGEVVAGGTDWILVGSDGVLRLDIDLTLRTDSGALIHADIAGYMAAEGKTRMLLADPARRGSVPVTDYSYRLSARFETGDGALGWLNRTLAVGSARLEEGGLHYRFLSVD